MHDPDALENLSPHSLSAGSENLSSRAYTAISEMIHTRRLRGGEVIVEARLAELLGVSRTPLREALQRLEGEGLVTKHANRSFMVRQVDLAEYLQSLKVREILEAEALANAFHRIDPDALRAAQDEIEDLAQRPTVHTEAHWRSDDRIHDLFANACGNPVMARMIKELRVTTRLFEIARLAERVEADHAEHKAILDAVQDGDVRKARRCVQAHIRSLSRHAVKNLG